MCGITGFIEANASDQFCAVVLNSMLDKIAHRGPDDQGVWISKGVALGHRRLSIVELSSAGKQPMASRCGRYIIIYNGEIYNHQELRANYLPNAAFRGHSDTELLIELISKFGLTDALVKCVGMFALALWDCDAKTLSLARDRLGEKPLYYGIQNNTFLFGSELKALKAHPSFQNIINWDSANSFLRHNFISAPNTIYQGIFKLLPGTSVSIGLECIDRKIIQSPKKYWSIIEAANEGWSDPFRGTFNDAVDQLDSLIDQSVRQQSIADVPVGAFLSGGIDSTAVVAMMQRQATSNVTTFCIGMPHSEFDESKHAAEIANYLGTKHIEHIITPSEALEMIPRLPEIWDEPLADSSQIPTFLVSQLARKHVKVALSGDGGDEFFLGYSHYPILAKIWRLRSLGILPWHLGLSLINSLPKGQLTRRFVGKAKFITDAWQHDNPYDLYSYWQDKYRDTKVPINRGSMPSKIKPFAQGNASCMFGLSDALRYLPDDILFKLDRASMANSLETRAPLLDHRIVEFSFKLPSNFKINKGVGKHILREVLYKKVPKKLIDRPKMGFSIPLQSWLKLELRTWVEDTISTVKHYDGVFDANQINEMWKSHLKGEKHYTEQLWGVLSLLTFLRRSQSDSRPQ